MGSIRLVFPAALPDSDAIRSVAYFAGWEGIPWRARMTIADGEITIAHGFEESGSLFLPWKTSSGTFLLSTALLRPQHSPYRLDVELARGTVHRVRQFVAQSELSGCAIADSHREQLREAEQHFLDAVTWCDDAARSMAAAQAAIDRCVELIPQLIGRVAAAALEIRCRHSPQLPTVLAGRLEDVPPSKQWEQQFLSTFNVATVSLLWREVQTASGTWSWEAVDRRLNWCRQRGLRVAAGPLLSFDRFQLPEWLFLWQDDFDGLCAAALEFLRATVHHCRGRVHFWYLASGVNVPGDFTLTDEQRLQFLAAAVEVVRKLDAQTPIIVTFAQPWGEYLSHAEFELSPLQLADTLVRADLGIAGVGPEFHLGYWPGGTPWRDVLEIAHHIDCWNSLNCPLLVVLTAPSHPPPDERAWQPVTVLPSSPDGLTPQWQCWWIEQVVPLLLAQPSVNGILWNQSRDAVPHPLPWGGLWDEQDDPKPALVALQKLRQRWLG